MIVPLEREDLEDAYQALHDLLPAADLLKLNGVQRHRINRVMEKLWDAAPSNMDSGPKQLD